MRTMSRKPRLSEEERAEQVDAALCELRRLRAVIADAVAELEQAYDRRLMLYEQLGDLGVSRSAIGEAAGVGAPAVAYALKVSGRGK